MKKANVKEKTESKVNNTVIFEKNNAMKKLE